MSNKGSSNERMRPLVITAVVQILFGALLFFLSFIYTYSVNFLAGIGLGLFLAGWAVAIVGSRIKLSAQ